MNAIAKDTLAEKEFDQLKTRLKATWMTGDYDLFSRFMEKDAEQFVTALNIKPGTRLLDVGCGPFLAAMLFALLREAIASGRWLRRTENAMSLSKMVA